MRVGQIFVVVIDYILYMYSKSKVVLVGLIIYIRITRAISIILYIIIVVIHCEFRKEFRIHFLGLGVHIDVNYM